MFERFLKVLVVFIYLPKFGFDTSKGSHTAAITEQCSSKPEEDAVTIQRKWRQTRNSPKANS